MYTIGLIPINNDVIKQEYEEWSNKYQCEIKIINRNDILQNLHQLDALLIEDNESRSINDGCELLMGIRKQSDLPIWICSFSETINKVKRIIYLQLGADGVIDESYDSEEFMLLIKNLLNRLDSDHLIKQLRKNELTSENSKSASGLYLISQNLSVCLEDGEEIPLTKLEFFAIECLHKHARETVTYEDLYKNVWKDSSDNRKYRVANVIFHLRKKIEKDVNKPKYIKTVRSRGYMLNV